MSLIIALCIGLAVGLLLQANKIRLLRQQLTEQQLRDALTGLYQRPHLFTLSAREVNRAQRSQSKMAVLIADMDHCAEINANHGLHAGDLALKRLAESALKSVRDFDLVGRYSGEEIALVLPDTDYKGAMVVAERLRNNVKQIPITLPNQSEFYISITIGLAAFDMETETFEDILVAADSALQSAKKMGVDRIEAFPASIPVVSSSLNPAPSP
ncbi:GGDEF domain-containing protein [Deefgea salmonis]|uniref:diguanylate cyclase n=1 Tax=Deefgea salmonis TaxID=2875502 RepID=A0ABS8BJR5_9NEIS|nr:GGDEF domain-containing protein [Deefgea salmonis]MCB5195862.1 GGDEF domain-containing protein [Deefgea salmonis]